MKRSRAFQPKQQQCAGCGVSLVNWPSLKIGKIEFCEDSFYQLKKQGYLHIDEVNGAHTFWLLQDDHLKKLILSPGQYNEFCADPNSGYLVKLAELEAKRHFIQFGPCIKCQGHVTNIPFKKPSCSGHPNSIDVPYFWYCMSCHEGFTFDGIPVGTVNPGRDFGKDYD